MQTAGPAHTPSMDTITKTELKPIQVKSTLPALPYPPLAARPVITTARLLIRPFTPDDLDALHAMRTQPEVMAWMPLGQVDADLARTRVVLAAKLAHDDRNYGFAICLAATGELIGTGGCHSRGAAADAAAANVMLGWPEVGYMLRREAWGQGYGTEFLAAFLDAWWAPPRCEAELTVDASTVDHDGNDGNDGSVEKNDEGSAAAAAVVVVVAAEERISSFTREDNYASRRVMTKAGMRLVKVWEVVDMRDGKTPIDLYGYTARRPAAAN